MNHRTATSSIRLFAVAALLWLATLATATQAQTTWVSTANATWNNAANWSSGLPTASGTAVFASGTGSQLSLNVGTGGTTGVTRFQSGASGYTLFSTTPGADVYLANGGGVTVDAGVTTNQTFNTRMRPQATGTTNIVNNGSGTLVFAGDTTNSNLQAFMSFSGLPTWQIAFSGSGSTQVASIVDRFNTSSTSVVKNDSGVLTILGGPSVAPTGTSQGWYRGGTTLNAGTLNVNGGFALGGGGVTINGGTLNVNAASALGPGGVTISGGMLGNTSGAAVTISTINAQTWAGDFGFAGPNDLNLGTGAVSLGSATRTLTISANTLTVGGGIGGSGGITKLGAGTLTLSASNSYTGTTTVNQGTLLITNSNALRGTTFAGGAGTLAFGLTVAGADNYAYLGGLSGSSDLTLTSTNGTSAVRLNFGLNNTDTTFSGNLTGTIGNQFVEKVGTGTTTISGNWTLGVSGTSVVSHGALSVIQGGLRQTGGVVTANRWDGSAAVAVGSGTGNSGSYVLESGTVNAINGLGAHLRIGQAGGTGILTIDGASSRGFFSGTNNTIGGNDIAATAGTGTLNLIAGELAVNSLTTGTVTGSQGTFNFSGGTLRPYSQNTTIGQGTGGFSIALSGNSPTLSGLDAAAGTPRNLTILTSLVNASGTTGGITIAGGTVTLSAANTYSGATTIGGTNTTLVLGSAGSFANSSTISVGGVGSSGAVLDLTVATGTFEFGSGQTVGGIGTIRIDGADAARFAGVLAPGNSPGILTFDGGTALLSGTTQIEIVSASRGTGYDAIDLINGAALDYDSGVLALDFGSWLADQQSYQLFGSGSSSLGGGFSSVTIAGANYAGLTFTASNGVWTSQGTSPANQTLTFTESTGVLVIVPEPATAALAAIGIAAVAYACRSRSLSRKRGGVT
jgi:fibronectin-binding autotransporter adhesin